jgi:hypothetical protein
MRRRRSRLFAPLRSSRDRRLRRPASLRSKPTACLPSMVGARKRRHDRSNRWRALGGGSFSRLCCRDHLSNSLDDDLPAVPLRTTVWTRAARDDEAVYSCTEEQRLEEAAEPETAPPQGTRNGDADPRADQEGRVQFVEKPSASRISTCGSLPDAVHSQFMSRPCSRKWQPSAARLQTASS